MSFAPPAKVHASDPPLQAARVLPIQRVAAYDEDESHEKH